MRSGITRQNVPPIFQIFTLLSGLLYSYASKNSFRYLQKMLDHYGYMCSCMQHACISFAHPLDCLLLVYSCRLTACLFKLHTTAMMTTEIEHSTIPQCNCRMWQIIQLHSHSNLYCRADMVYM